MCKVSVRKEEGRVGGAVKSVGVRDGVSEEERDKMEWLNGTGMTMEA